MGQDLKDQALAVLTNNSWTAKYQGKIYPYTVPSPTSYPFQWFWDSCFHAIAWTHFDPERAKDEMRSLLTAQDREGFIPHVIFWDRKKALTRIWHFVESKEKIVVPFLPVTFLKPKTTGEIQPPLIAQAISRIYAADRDLAFIKEVLPQLNTYYCWLLTVRDPDKDSLIAVISPYETGLDCSPAFDGPLGFTAPPTFPKYQLSALRVTLTNKFFYNYDSAKALAKGYFNVEDVLMNAILALNLDILADLNHQAGDFEKAKAFTYQARRVTDALIAKCWDKERGLFFNLSGREEKQYKVATYQSLMPLIIPWIPKEIATRIIEEHLLNPKEFWTNYPPTSVAMNEATFSAEVKSEIFNHQPLIWRGTSWININWYLAAAIKRHGYPDVAEKIVNASRSLVQQSGFREHFNPFTGEGYGAKSYGWTTLVIDM